MYLPGVIASGCFVSVKRPFDRTRHPAKSTWLPPSSPTCGSRPSGRAGPASGWRPSGGRSPTFSTGGAWRHVAELVEVESGSRDNRPCLSEAMALCRLHGATLVIAKLDRLSRDAAFLLNLQKAGVRFVAADMPEANELVVGIMAVVAQAERKMISDPHQGGPGGGEGSGHAPGQAGEPVEPGGRTSAQPGVPSAESRGAGQRSRTSARRRACRGGGLAAPDRVGPEWAGHPGGAWWGVDGCAGPTCPGTD